MNVHVKISFIISKCIISTKKMTFKNEKNIHVSCELMKNISKLHYLKITTFKISISLSYGIRSLYMYISILHTTQKT